MVVVVAVDLTEDSVVAAAVVVSIIQVFLHVDGLGLD